MLLHYCLCFNVSIDVNTVQVNILYAYKMSCSPVQIQYNTFIYVCTFTFPAMESCFHTHSYSMYIRTYAHTYIHTYICTYIHVYVYMHANMTPHMLMGPAVVGQAVGHNRPN